MASRVSKLVVCRLQARRLLYGGISFMFAREGNRARTTDAFYVRPVEYTSRLDSGVCRV